MYDDILSMFCLIRRNFQASREEVENDLFWFVLYRNNYWKMSTQHILYSFTFKREMHYLLINT